MVYKLKRLIVMFFGMFEFFLCKSIFYLYFFFIVFNVLASRQNGSVTMEDKSTTLRCNRNNDFINMSRVDISRLFVVNGMDAEQKKILVNTTREVQEEDEWLQHLPVHLHRSQIIKLPY